MLRIGLRRLAYTAFVAPLLVFAFSAHATTVVQRTLDELVREVDRVVVGEIVSIEQHWTEDDLVMTEAVMRVEEQLLGDGQPATVVLRAPGGSIDGYTTVVPGAAAIGEAGQRMIIFLWDDRPEYMSNVAYWGLGQYLVSEEGIVERTGQPESEFIHHLQNRIARSGR
jgi:hypothetical protein